MFKFFEPEDEYKTEKGRKRNVKTKINVMTFLIVFFGVLIFAVQQDFVKVFGKQDIKEYCFFNNSFSLEDDREYQTAKAEQALRGHLDTFKDLDGYLDSRIGFKDNDKLLNPPEIYIILDRTSTEKGRVPKILCGYKLIVKTE